MIMLRFYSFILVIFLGCVMACSPKKELALDKTNLREALMQYAQTNPETALIIRTSMGDIELKLYEDTPLHRANFLRLVKEGYFEKADFYRVVPGFAIQGSNQVGKKESFLIPAEFNPKHYHKKGALAMAHFDEGNPEKASSPTEFYLVQGERYTEENLKDDEAEYGITATPEQRKDYTTLGGNMELDGKYTVFGEVTKGLEVIDKIAAVKVIGERPLQKIPFSIELAK
jgi:cyclophilin family peptidyl-prolyl cis-trans isomerase